MASEVLCTSSSALDSSFETEKKLYFPRPLTHKDEQCKHSDAGIDYECLQQPAMTMPSYWHPRFPAKLIHEVLILQATSAPVTTIVVKMLQDPSHNHSAIT